jgi:hypothetical protein
MELLVDQPMPVCQTFRKCNGAAVSLCIIAWGASRRLWCRCYSLLPTCHGCWFVNAMIFHRAACDMLDKHVGGAGSALVLDAQQWTYTWMEHQTQRSAVLEQCSSRSALSCNICSLSIHAVVMLSRLPRRMPTCLFVYLQQVHTVVSLARSRMGTIDIITACPISEPRRSEQWLRSRLSHLQLVRLHIIGQGRLGAGGGGGD